ncbi:MAG: sensor domain-containing diguanylate cyclase [Chloroflexota bacterium]|nr:sensor domain-containing diguanylate cyclase [Chloroflexota bacterium]
MLFTAKPWKGTPGKPGLNEVVERLKWVVGVRWTVVLALLLVGILGRVWRGDSTETSLGHIALALFVALYNLYYLLITRQPDMRLTRLTPFARYVQIPVDLVVFTAIVHFSGGVTGPVFVLYFLYIFVGLSILPPSGAYLIAGIAAACYAGLCFLEAMWLKPPAGVTTILPVAQIPLQTYLGYSLTVGATLMIIAYIANFFAGLLTRNEGTIREQLSEINTLYSFTRTISSTLDSDDVLRLLVSTASEIERASSCSLLLFNDRGEASFAATKGFTPEQINYFNNGSLSGNSPVVKVLLSQGKGIYAPDAEQRPDLKETLLRASTKSFYAIPMWNDKTQVGMLNLSFERRYRMDISHWNLLSAMTQQAALAIERTRLFADTQRAARESTSLYQIGLVTISSLKIDEVLHLIYQQVDGLLHPDTFYIALYDEDLGELRYDIFVEAGEVLPAFRAHLQNMGSTSWVIRNRKTIVVHNWNMEAEQLPFEANVVGAQTQSMVSVPLIAKDKIVGVMSVQALQPDAYDASHVRLLTQIGNQAALTLENARLHATVNEQAQRDSLTGAYNHGTFIDKLNQAMCKPLAECGTLALIMLDVDKFKQYNDTYGHLIGNDVLRAVVEAIQGHVKATDVVARWGGEEFAIMLMGVTRTQARLVAERIRQTTAHNVVKNKENKTVPSPTVSQGIALYPEDATDIQELIGKADQALYRAKDMGRNNIVEWITMDAEGMTGLRVVNR